MSTIVHLAAKCMPKINVCIMHILTCQIKCVYVADSDRFAKFNGCQNFSLYGILRNMQAKEGTPEVVSIGAVQWPK